MLCCFVLPHLFLARVQVSRPSKYHQDWGVLLGPTSPDPTINTSMLSISSGNGTPVANGAPSDAARKPANPNRLYISGLPYNWRTQHVSGSTALSTVCLPSKGGSTHTRHCQSRTRQLAASCPKQLAPAAAERVPRSTAAAAAAVTVSRLCDAVGMRETARACAALLPCLLVC